MSKVNKNIELVKKVVTESVSSVFTKEDVLKLFKRIEDSENEGDESSDKITVNRDWLIDLLENAKDNITGEIDSMDIHDVCDLDDIELSLEGRELSIDTSNLHTDFSNASNAVSSEIESVIDEINNL